MNDIPKPPPPPDKPGYTTLRSPASVRLIHEEGMPETMLPTRGWRVSFQLFDWVVALWLEYGSETVFEVIFSIVLEPKA